MKNGAQAEPYGKFISPQPQSVVGLSLQFQMMAVQILLCIFQIQ